MRNTTSAWGGAARAFHWVLAVLIIGMVAYGYWMNHFAPRTDRFFHRSIHADIGYIVLVLTVLRLIWRLFNPAPLLPAGTPRFERAIAHLNHGLLYVLTLIVVFLGWAHSGAHKPDYASFFGLFRVPQFTSENREAAGIYEERHILMAYALLALVVVHVLAALYHHFIRRDTVLTRMVRNLPR